MFPHHMRSRIPCACTLSRRLEIIELLYKFLEPFIEQLFPRHPNIEPMVHATPLHFVLKRLLELLPAHDHLRVIGIRLPLADMADAQTSSLRFSPVFPTNSVSICFLSSSVNTRVAFSRISPDFRNCQRPEGDTVMATHTIMSILVTPLT